MVYLPRLIGGMLMAVSYSKLWKLLIDKKMTKTELRQRAGLTTNAIANMGKEESVQVETLFKICKVLGCGLDDLCEMVDGVEGNK